MAAFSEDFISDDDFEAVLATNWCYDYGSNVSEADVKITTDLQKIITNAPWVL